jgi:aryl-alcohol dehydrogenase-like predicted oxidoreductase
MRYFALGRSGLLLSRIGLGTMIFGESSARGTDEAGALRLIHTFLEAGGNHIDTANVYAKGRAEEIVGKAIRDRRLQVVLATKVRFSMGDAPNDAGLSRYHIMRSVEDSLLRLQTEVIDLLYMHCWDPLTPLEESLRAFDDLVTAGKVRYIGVSNFKAWQLMKALGLSEAHGWARFTAAQYQYSLVSRDIELEFSELCVAEGVGIIPWGPLGGGFLSGKYQPDQRHTRPEEGRLAVQPDQDEEAWVRRATTKNWRILAAVQEVASQHPGSSPAQVALAWLLTQPAVCSLVIGARTIEQLQDNLGALSLALTQEEIRQLDEVSKPEKGYPYRFIELYGSRSIN